MSAVVEKARRFKGWAEGNGGEALPLTSEYELARIKHADGTLVIYRNKKGHVSFSDSIARKAWAAFMENRPFPMNKRHKRTKTEAMVSRLIERDGNACFFCGKPFTPDMPPTIEHLLSIAKGGNNQIANLTLACECCNRAVGSDDVAEKIKFRDKQRA
ncbi:HNH endonuclease [Sulfitobacter pseudonitzschiae]|uniref:HNH endonuclease n=1 Tax=Pseudosulfitobacter pseudonitzschiae TaxID=1402135 RepID=A0A9Q2NKQ2_9RHOB|nr:HNH endonuclease [Pseudosulfitobacter pseudonitzschiae]MBM2293783.1 HNH endonuclease [Pseudosulfitobacter pseudonitzschiae]MBM2298701.1 HNH endonuclease [Pseudosulfitobacter pseudonitzschiae]MBM2303615.1 HNH endonuclease [Pseudosulfitobacter pseudonitzschiae]MBM2313398.1 HNH endonuclease [Pseudosulfitobacter pseudonitzschiae]MBM2318311.1 HNH endonuclease [Pseudosulfitobacter pseudonitzschiae]